MGLRNVIDKSVNTAFNAIGDLKDDLTLVFVSKSEHDSNTLYVNETTSNIDFEGVVVKYKKRQIDGVAIKPNDLQILANASDLVNGTNGLYEPTTQDKIIFEGKTFDIKDVDPAPGKSMYKIQIRSNEL